MKDVKVSWSCTELSFDAYKSHMIMSVSYMNM